MRQLVQHAIAASLTMVLVVGCSPPQSNLPPILRNLHAGGWQGVCPFPTDDPALAKHFAARIDPPGEIEFTNRLLAAFPPGTREDSFLSGIKKLGFQVKGHCDHDRTIGIAFYDEKPTFKIVSLSAFIYWKANADHKLLWTKGNVGYTGL